MLCLHSSSHASIHVHTDAAAISYIHGGGALTSSFVSSEGKPPSANGGYFTHWHCVCLPNLAEPSDIEINEVCGKKNKIVLVYPYSGG